MQSDAFNQIQAADADDFMKFDRRRCPGQFHGLQDPAIQGRTQMSVKGFAGAPSFHVADRFSRADHGREQASLTIGVGGDQSLHGIQHVDNLGFFPGNGVYGDEGKKHSRVVAQSEPLLWPCGLLAIDLKL